MSQQRRTLDAVVTATRALTPAMRRVVLRGPDLALFRIAAGALGPYLKLRFETSGGCDLVRTYSVRRFDSARAELHVDILLHGDGGPGSRFGAGACVGDRVRLGGPGHIPAEPCAAYLVAGDQTALPAIAHILETLPPGTRVRALIEVPGSDEEQELATGPGVHVTWLHRRTGVPSRLAEAVRAEWPCRESDLLVWAGAEAMIARAIRTEARRARGVPPARCQVLNYWKCGQPEGGFSYVDEAG